MTRKTLIILLIVLAVVAVLLTTWWIGSVFQPNTLQVWLVRLAFLLFCVAVAAGMRWYAKNQSGSARNAAASKDIGHDVAHTVASARTALNGGGLKGGLARRPIVLVIGRADSAKTSTIVNSGSRPHPLAGEYRAGDPQPTQGINVWYVSEQDTAFVEVGGGFGDDKQRWGKLLHLLRPRNPAALVYMGEEPPRSAVLCVSCDDVINADTAGLKKLAKNLGGRLAIAAQQFGVRLPVYVLFTKADRIPNFDAYVQRLDVAESNSILGTTIPFDFTPNANQYMDRLGSRIKKGFDSLFHSLELRRSELLEREPNDDAKGLAYEFPVAFRHAAGKMSFFLKEVMRPTHLVTNPLLRGFYFVGRRPSVNNSQPAPHNPGRERKQATGDWEPLFLRQWFRNVLLSDATAKRVTAFGSGTDLGRRAGLITAVAFSGFMTFCFAVSHSANVELRDEVLVTIGTLDPIRPSQKPTVATMTELERLWQHWQRLDRYAQNGRPMHMGWFLYSGSRIEPNARRVYAAAYDSTMLAPVITGLEQKLAALRPDSPGQDGYLDVKNTLKAYLMLTTPTQWANIDHDFFDAQLVRYWFNGGSSYGAPSDVDSLAAVQFSRYGTELCSKVGVNCPSSNDPTLVTGACNFLQSISDADRIYDETIARASSDYDAVSLTNSLIEDAHVVPGAFTAEAWPLVQAQLAEAGDLGEDTWICPGSTQSQNSTEIINQNRAKYAADYKDHWIRFLQSATFVRFRTGGYRDAAEKYEIIGGEESPLNEFFSLISRHTSIDLVTLAPAFLPVHRVAPPALNAPGDKIAPYYEQLSEIKTALNDLVAGSNNDPNTGLSAVNRAQRSVADFARSIADSGDASVRTGVQAMLISPVTQVEDLLRRHDVRGLIGQIDGFCREFRSLAAKYPFNPSAGISATPNEVRDMFDPDRGRLWQLYNDVLSPEGLIATPTGYRREGGSNIPSSIERFFNSAAGISNLLFGRTSALEFTFRIRSVVAPDNPEASTITLNVDGQPLRFTRTDRGFQNLVWRGVQARDARLTAVMGSQSVTLSEEEGPWALFRLFSRTDWQGGPVYLVTWPSGRLNLNGRITAEVVFERDSPILETGTLTPLACRR